jgi:hypothetical protein
MVSPLEAEIVIQEIRFCSGDRFHIVRQVLRQIGVLINEAAFFLVQHSVVRWSF